MSVGHYENFPVASLLLPRELREPVGVIYRFARTADDFADEGSDAPRPAWRSCKGFRLELQGIRRAGRPKRRCSPILRAIVREHALPLQLFHDLLDAFSQDVVKNRYADFAEVLDYSRRSANPVGRLLLHLFRQEFSPKICAFSDRICSALQLINFWQDVRIDYETKNRIYLPQDEMRRFGVTEEHLRQHLCDAGVPGPDALPGRSRAAHDAGGQAAAWTGWRAASAWRSPSPCRAACASWKNWSRRSYDMFRHRPVHQWFDWPLLFYRAL